MSSRPGLYPVLGDKIMSKEKLTDLEPHTIYLLSYCPIMIFTMAYNTILLCQLS